MTAETFLSAEQYAHTPDAVEAWLDELRVTTLAAQPNAAHLALAAYQSRYPDTTIFTQNVDMLLERAGARTVIHLHGRLDQMRCVGHAHALPLGSGARAAAPARCPQCNSRLRSDVVLFGERAPAYALLRSALRRATRRDALVVIGTQGNVLPVNEFARRFAGRKILNNLHPSASISSHLFDEVFEAPAAQAAERIVAILEEWRANRLGRDE